MKAFRKFSQFEAKLQFPEALIYTRPWKNIVLPNELRISYDETSDFTSNISILTEIGSRNMSNSQKLLSDLNNFLGSGFSYKCYWDKTIINLTTLKEDTESIIKELVKRLKTLSDSSTKQKNTEEDILEILYKTCYQKKSDGLESEKTSEKKLEKDFICGKNTIISAKGVQNSVLSYFSDLVPGSSNSFNASAYKPTMLILETSSEENILCIANEAPSLFSQDYYVFKFLEKLMNFENLFYIDNSKQYNYLYSLLGSIPGVFSHSAFYLPSKDSGVFIHLLKTHSLSTTFAGSAIIKSMNRVCKQITPKEIERTKKTIFNDILMKNTQILLCEQRNEEIRTGRQKNDYTEFVLNVNEEYLCNRLSH